MNVQFLDDLLILKLQSLYDIEQEIIKALPKMAKAATDEKLKALFEQHLEETKQQKTRLEEIFDLFELKPKKVEVEAIRGLVADANWLLDQEMSPEALDASLVAAAQYIEHYEMAGYGSAASWAKKLGIKPVAKLLGQTLKEEEKADKLLTKLAEKYLNEEALYATVNEDA